VYPHDHIIFVVDDDIRIRESLSELLASFDLHVVTFASAAEYLAYPRPEVPACLILDVQLPDINGLDLQSRQRAKSSEDRVHYRTRRHTLFSARDQGGRGRLPHQALQEADLMRAIHAAIAQDRDTDKSLPNGASCGNACRG